MQIRLLSLTLLANPYILSTALDFEITLDMSAAGVTSSAARMLVKAVRKSQVAYPTGRKDFAVMQPFPSAVTTEESDPFLMCDLFGPMLSSGVETNPDKYPVEWHPHRGMDIATYIIEGRGRHADSMGNRGFFDSPGMQWCSVGSGIEHAEAGGTPAGDNMTGFQIWINVPAARKMDDPRYGTVPPSALPVVSFPGGVSGRLLAGTLGGDSSTVGPFQTVQELLMLDLTLPPSSAWELPLAPHLDSVMAFVYRGDAVVNGAPVPQHSVALMDASGPARTLAISTQGVGGASVMVFAGVRLNQPVAWHGPFVMTTDAEIKATVREYQSGAFPPVRVPWDYKRLAAFPRDHSAWAATGTGTAS